MQNRTLFAGGRIVLPDRVTDGSLLVEDGKITGVLSKGAGERISGCQVVDVSGKILLPGLVDTHVHMWVRL